MNDKTEVLIRDLAEKFGTTVEHLWEVMVRQALVVGVVDLTVLTLWAFALVWAYQVIRVKTYVPKPTLDNINPCSEWDNDKTFVAWKTWAALVFIFVIVLAASLANIIGALVNPEYWAIKKLLP